MPSTPLLELRNVSCSVEPGQPLFHDVNLSVNEGDILVLQGRSGCGKSTLLKCIAHLVLHDGETRYRGSTPQKQGIPSYRTRVLYVPQRPSLLPGTPRDFLKSISSLSAHKAASKTKPEAAAARAIERALEISSAWAIEGELWEREWSNLSGGEAQRIVLAVAVALNTAEVLLLDEPTSALDAESSSMVEKYLVNEIHSDSMLKALVWITHSEEQGRRVGTRFIQLCAGGCTEDPTPPV
ncbi:P-loop containing nucleoside triphosphate hydrolase protein [Crucibulum laeve]|uniref:P-loop containing nucleoside triphosphate hydrolase protein n=1 Tax=Crucibulum laeve TaxID=68775 RepID=A0A5C3MB82_9AGAR|nr:P-loop containing nucleoside triphosphate hydrolase protein [Crucibulum laeve]